MSDTTLQDTIQCAKYVSIVNDFTLDMREMRKVIMSDSEAKVKVIEQGITLEKIDFVIDFCSTYMAIRLCGLADFSVKFADKHGINPNES